MQDACNDLKSTPSKVQVKAIGPLEDRFYLLNSAGHLWMLPRANLHADIHNTTLTIDQAPLKISEVFDGIDESQLEMRRYNPSIHPNSERLYQFFLVAYRNASHHFIPWLYCIGNGAEMVSYERIMTLPSNQSLISFRIAIRLETRLDIS